MFDSRFRESLFRRSLLGLLALLLAATCAAPAMAQSKSSKKPADAQSRKQEADRELKRRLAAGDQGAQKAVEPDAAVEQAPPPVAMLTPNWLDLWLRGGPLMFPITFISFLVVLFACERALALRRRKVRHRRGSLPL